MNVVLVDENDSPIGVKEKLTAHIDGDLHRAFSVFLFTPQGLLLQQRAESKYHCGGLWSNTVCSHPKPGEDIIDAGKRRVKEELGIDAPRLQNIGHLLYRANVGDLIEHEYDHILIGRMNRVSCNPNREEVQDLAVRPFNQVLKDVKQNPRKYTPWFRLILEKDIVKKE